MGRPDPNASHQRLGFAQMLRDVFVTSINKGQFLVALIGFIVAIVILKMPPNDVSRVVFRIVDSWRVGGFLDSSPPERWPWAGSGMHAGSGD